MTQPQQVQEQPEDLTVAEMLFAAAVAAALAAWLPDVRALVMAPFNLFGLAPDASAIDRAVPAWNRAVDRLMSDLEALSRQGWAAAAESLNVQLPFDPDDNLLRQQLQRSRNLMVNIPNEIYRDVLRELAVATNNGETVAQQARRVSNLLDYHGTQNWPHRGTVVARTEVPRAYTWGGLAAAGRAQAQSRRLVTKTWDARRDSATRIAHKAANGQRRFLGQPFTVGGEALDGPLDPTGRPDNVIQCRCRLDFGWSA